MINFKWWVFFSDCLGGEDSLFFFSMEILGAKLKSGRIHGLIGFFFILFSCTINLYINLANNLNMFTAQC